MRAAPGLSEGDARTVSRECALLFRRRTRDDDAPAEGKLVYEMNDIGKYVVVDPKTYENDIYEACREVDDEELCSAHVSQLKTLLEMIAKARDLRLVVWEDSFVSSSRFADLQLNAIEHWTDFEKRPRAYAARH